MSLYCAFTNGVSEMHKCDYLLDFTRVRTHTPTYSAMTFVDLTN